MEGGQRRLGLGGNIRVGSGVLYYHIDSNFQGEGGSEGNHNVDKKDLEETIESPFDLMGKEKILEIDDRLAKTRLNLHCRKYFA